MNSVEKSELIRPEVGIHPESVAAGLVREGVDAGKAAEVAAGVTAAVNRTIRPAVLYNWFRVDRVGTDHILAVCEGNDKAALLHTGGFSPFFEQAEAFIAGIYTLGPEIDDLGNRYLSDGNDTAFRAVNIAALSALSATACAIAGAAEARAREEKMGVSPPVSPGSVKGWSYDGQQELCALFDMAPIGVTIGADNFLAPMNTLSVVVTVGPGFSDTRVGVPCRLCRMAGNCTFSCINRRITETVHAVA